ncbi:MAG: methyltransferase domain-containing protein [Cytophagales bacterium]|nr:methyltransferase domain-containing protein [Cytophagales bacterium]
MIIEPEKDPMGQVILAYHQGDKDAVLDVETTLTEGEELSGEYLFRSHKDFPIMEKKAMELCKGKILDAGGGAGCHSIYLKEKGFEEVKAIDISRLSVEVMKERGLNAHLQNITALGEEKFDTMLFLMNGIGMVGVLEDLPLFLQNIKKNLNEGGQILLDSSDIIYMFMEDDGSAAIDLNADYYGQIQYFLKYKEWTAPPFNWLFVAYDILEDYATANGFHCEKIIDGEHYDYLARLTWVK